MFVVIVLYPIVLVALLWLVMDEFDGAPFFTTVLTVTMGTGNFVMIALLIYYRRKTRDSWLAAEAAQWLVLRSRQSNASRSIWRGKLLRSMLWIPSILALAVFLFFPETIGIASHLLQSQSVGRYRLHLPVTWIIVEEGRYSLCVVAGKGMAHVGFSPYWRWEEPVSEMTFSAYPGFQESGDARLSKKSQILSTRTIHIGQGEVTCWDIATYYGFTFVEPGHAWINCYDPAIDFRASFSGLREDVPRFYRIVKNASLRK